MKPFIPAKVAEVLFALIIAYFGYTHFNKAASMSGWVPDFMPGDPKIWIYVVGACFILAAIAILTELQKVMACYLLAALLLLLGFLVHWKNGMLSVDFLKNTSMALMALLIGSKK
jgi:uncharacterized membrane protein